MKISYRSMLSNPLMAWTDLAWKIGEMSMASAQVIAHRTTRMTAAGPLPNARDREEFTRMGQEKVDAASESARSMLTHLTTTNLALAARMFGHMMTAATGLTSLAASRTPTQYFARQAKLAEAVARSGTTATELSRSTARLATRGLKPIHARATANARRLGKR